ncbi:MAG: 5-oxoprolinase subunit PxpB [Desulfitobacteriaceae bacterium]
MSEDNKHLSIFRVHPYGDGAIHVQFGQNISEESFAQVQSFSLQIQKVNDPRIIDFLPAYHSVTLFYGPRTTYKEMYDWVHALNDQAQSSASVARAGRLVEIPVCYGGEYGPDLNFVAEYHSLSPEEVVKRHSEAEYLVYMIGFMPGFPFMGGLDSSLATPRLSKPRTLVPKGSVGIAGQQTGLYPLDSPGGWQLIGRTPLKMFDARRNPPTVLRSGDRVRFLPISGDQYETIQS